MNSPNQPPKDQRPGDPLLQRYQEANAHDGARPNPELRDRVLAHARSMVQQRNTPEAESRPTAANDGDWKLRALGSLAVLGLVGLLVLQFDRGTPDEQTTAWGPSRQRSAQPSDEVRPSPAKDAALAPSLDRPSASPPPPAGNIEPSQPSASHEKRPAEPQAAPAPTPPSATPLPESSRAEASHAPIQAMSPKANTVETQDSDGATALSSAPTQRGRSLDTSDAPAMNQTPPSPFAAEAEVESTGPAAGQLLKQRSTSRAQSPASSTVLHTAAMEADTGAIAQALAQGLSVDTPDNGGRTALMLAAQGTSKAVIEQLLKAGASRQARDQQGLNAADHARQAGRLDWLALLRP